MDHGLTVSDNWSEGYWGAVRKRVGQGTPVEVPCTMAWQIAPSITVIVPAKKTRWLVGLASLSTSHPSKT